MSNSAPPLNGLQHCINFVGQITTRDFRRVMKKCKIICSFHSRARRNIKLEIKSVCIESYWTNRWLRACLYQRPNSRHIAKSETNCEQPTSEKKKCTFIADNHTSEFLFCIASVDGEQTNEQQKKKKWMASFTVHFLRFFLCIFASHSHEWMRVRVATGSTHNRAITVVTVIVRHRTLYSASNRWPGPFAARHMLMCNLLMRLIIKIAIIIIIATIFGF